MENNSKLVRAVAVSRSNFKIQSAFSQKDKEEKFNNSEKFAEKKFVFLFYLFVVVDI